MAKTENPQNSKFDRLGLVASILPAAFFVFLLTQLGPVLRGETLLFSLPWMPSLGIGIDLWVDGLSLLFGLVITLVGALVMLYAGAYLVGYPQLKRFYLIITLFMFAMLGVVFSRNLITLFVFWELTSLTSYLLIGFYHEKEDSRKAALQALLVTGSGGLLLLIGFILLGMVGGSYDIGVLISQAASIQADPLYAAILILVLLGAFTKSAQFPFHFWLPNAMAAPAPVSAYLHSATMVKAGIYLLARLTPLLGGTELWTNLIVPVGAVTMLLAAWIALGQTDLKRILAYSTVSVLGMLTFLLGLGSSLAVKAAMALLVAHSLYKGALFLAAGTVDHETGTREVIQLGGLRKLMPLTALTVGLVALSQAGIPPLFGFISKELLYEVTLASPQSVLFTGLALATSILLVSVALVVAIRPFFGSTTETPKKAHEASWPMTSGPLLLAGLSLAFGLFPGWAGKTLVAPAVNAVLGADVKVKLALWHGFTPMLALSGITILLGLAVFWGWQPFRKLVRGLDLGERIGPAYWYDRSLARLDCFADELTRLVQNGSLPGYILAVLLTAIGLIGYTLLRQVEFGGLFSWPERIHFYEFVFPLLIVVATVAAVRARSRLAAVAALGVVGFSVAMIYILFGAPDLAMTQFAIETLTVILFVFVLYRLPRFTIYTTKNTRARDAVVALAAGAMMTLLVLVVTARPLVSRLTPYFAENSYLLAKGRNIVNVILVDFRGIDTLGEITVLAVAAIGVFALMKLRTEK